MDTLTIFVCENFLPEYSKVAEQEAFDDVVVVSYPCLCESKTRKAETAALLRESINPGGRALILCSRNCDITKLVPQDSAYEIRSTNYCFNHLANDEFINYILQRGGYIIGLGWLQHWRDHLRIAGFDRETARRFYREFCTELVFFDAGIDASAIEKLQDLSEYLSLPYVVVPYELDSIRWMIRTAVYEWRLQKAGSEHAQSLTDLQMQCAEYSAILDLIGKISSFTSRRETIDKIKEIFIMILGARQFKYWPDDENRVVLPEEFTLFHANKDQSVLFLKEDNRFCIKIQQNGKLYGIIDVSDFLFPEYIEKYLNFAIEIAQVCGLVLSSIEHYENLIRSEKELQYLSFHDSLTGLYNRTYLAEAAKTPFKGKTLTVFMFDIDRLKYVNDTFGHAEGDNLIRGFSEILKKWFRETDTVARIGGDEFVAILPDCDREMAEMFTSRVKEAIARHNRTLSNPLLSLSVSMGYAVSANAEINLEHLSKIADERMFQDKMEKKRNS